VEAVKESKFSFHLLVASFVQHVVANAQAAIKKLKS